MDTAIRFEAIEAFAARSHLSKGTVARYKTVFGDVDHGTAWETTIDYAQGNLDEDGEDLDRIIAAWLHFGEKVFRTIFDVTLAVHRSLDLGAGALDYLAQELSRIFGHTVEAIRSQLRRLEGELGSIERLFQV